MKKARWYILILIFLLCGLTARSQKSREMEVFRYIEENKTDSIEYFLEQGNDINGIYPRNTLLEIAIVHNKIDVVDLLINHKVNVNLQNNRATPLLLSVAYGQRHQSNKIVEMLVNNNADVNFVGVNGLTPFVLACKINNSTAAEFLYENGADPSMRDAYDNDFFYYVLRGEDPALIRYFTSKGFEIPRMSSIDDGPYVPMPDNGDLEVYHMQYDSLTDSSKWSRKDVGDENIGLPNRGAIEAFPKKDYSKDNDTFRKAGDIFVVSDIHGHYDHFVTLLRANKIINRDLEWAFGKGHLVITGDVFDRGDKVTECLWLIFILEYQAEKSGGKVHYLLGNHELMILKDNNKTYANDKYILPYAKAGVDYHDLFSRNYVLGRWLRAKNVAVKIRQFLFVHGGIPPYYVAQRRTLGQMNRAIHEYMSDTSDLILDANNIVIEPTWYREYFGNSDMSDDLSKVCDFYKVDKIIVGHTPVDQVKMLQGDFVIGVGIHFGGTERPPQGLLISDDAFYRCNEKGNKIQL